MNDIDGLIEEGEALRTVTARTMDEGRRNPRGSWSNAEAAAEWRRTAAVRNVAIAEATERMLARAGIRPGMRVLVLGAGSGDDAAFVAERVGSRGSVLATDLSPSMVDACQETMRALGLSWVESRVMDAAASDVEEASFDAVVSRHGLMFTPRLDRALAGAHAALRPGGRFAMTTWGPLGNNPMFELAFGLARSMGAPAQPTCEVALAFSLSDADALAAALTRGGFADVAIDHEPLRQRFASAAAAIDTMQKGPPAALFAPLDDARRAEAWRELERAYARFDAADGWGVDGESLIASGDRSRLEACLSARGS
jgi:SAM-dependent methyltransferase